MKNLKTTILTACIALCCLTNVNAQENARKNRGKVMTPGSSGTIVVLGGGTSMPSSDGKDKAFLSNTTAINADAFFSLISKPEANFSFGLNFGGTYNFAGSGGFGTTPNPYAVTGQTSSMVSDRGGDPIQAGFRMGAGPQANFYFGKFIISPMVLGEYFSMTQKEMSIVQTTVVGGQSYEFNLATLPETKTSGFAVTPKLRLQYMISDRFGLFADASYTTGPKIETTVSKLIPNGNPSPQSGSYNIQQLQTGTMVKGETKSTAYSAMGFNFGVVIGLGGNSHGDNLTNGIVKPACTCCGSKVHDRIECPDITRCNTQTASSQVALSDDLHKAEEDIKKGWNGTVKGLFVGKNTDILVTKNGGIEKLIDQINKGGKGKATIEKYGEDKFIKIVRKEKDIFISEFYPYNDYATGPMGIIVGGFSRIRCQGSCGEGCNLNIEKTACTPCENMASCALIRTSGSPYFHDYYDFGSMLSPDVITVSSDATGTLTATSINDLKNIMLQTFPKATVTKSEIIKEGKDKFIKVDLNENGNVFSVLNYTNNPNNTWILIYCAGSCNGSAEDCSFKSAVINMVGLGCNCPGDNKCFGVSGIVFGLSSDIRLE